MGFLELRLYAPCQADRTLETVRLAEILHGESGEPIITSFINKNETLCKRVQISAETLGYCK